MKILLLALVIIIEHIMELSVAKSANASPSQVSAALAHVQIYELGSTPCRLEISDVSGGQAYSQENKMFFGFSRIPQPKGGELNFSFTCIEPSHADYCQVEWRKDLESEHIDTVKLMAVSDYGNFHPRYDSSAYSANMTAVSEPRPRNLFFCIGNGDVAITGVVSVGVENSFIPKAARAIHVLETIKILQPPKIGHQR